MPDISMCSNFNCPIKETCYRYMAKPSYHQSYSIFIYENGCDWYIDYAEEKLSNAEEEIKDLNARIEELEGQVSELESELDAIS